MIGKLTGPMDNSPYNFVKLSFKEGFDPSFITDLTNTITKRVWERTPLSKLPLTSLESSVRSHLKKMQWALDFNTNNDFFFATDE